MRKKWLFLRWALLISLTAVAAIIAWKLGAFHFAYKSDASKLTFVILAVFAVMTAWCGRLTWKANEWLERDPTKFLSLQRTFLTLENDSRHIAVAADICTMLGLLGTITGMIMAFFGSSGFQMAEQQERLGVAVGTAFITTFAGLVCSILLVIQHHNLQHALRRADIRLGGGAGGGKNE